MNTYIYIYTYTHTHTQTYLSETGQKQMHVILYSSHTYTSLQPICL